MVIGGQEHFYLEGQVALAIPGEEVLSFLVRKQALGEQVTVAKLNIEESPTTPSRYGVRGIPTMMLFKDGQMASMKVGAMPKQKIVEWLNEAGI